MIKGLKKRTLIMAVIIVALLSCAFMTIAGAEYFSKISGRLQGNATKFIIRTTSSDDNKNMTLTPSVNGNYVGYEFYVSNFDDNGVSGVDQFYCVGIAAPKVIYNQIIDSLNTKVMVMPILVKTTDSTMTVDKLLKNYADVLTSNDFISNESITIYNEGSILYDNGADISIPLQEDKITYTWFDGESAVKFSFSANKETTHKYFLIFFAKYIENNVLATDETYDISDIQIVTYSEQLDARR